MGQSCTKTICHAFSEDSSETATNNARKEWSDPVVYDLMRKSISASTPDGYQSSRSNKRRRGQSHLLFKHNKPPQNAIGGLLQPETSSMIHPTRLIVRRRSSPEHTSSENHIYAIRYPDDPHQSLKNKQITSTVTAMRQEQCPARSKSLVTSPVLPPVPILEGAEVFQTGAMASTPRQKVVDWVEVSQEHKIYIADVGLTPAQCDHIVSTTEQVCKGTYAAYTYAKQTLGCREYPPLALSSFLPVHSVVHSICNRLEQDAQRLQLDDREPHIVKYDITKKERQKLDMHTDKSEWTFLIALSNGCDVDYDGGGTYFECLDATVHIQRGHALIFPGKLRHCGQRITSGLRFLLVGFLVDKRVAPDQQAANLSPAPQAVAHSSSAAAPSTVVASAVAAPET